MPRPGRIDHPGRAYYRRLPIMYAAGITQEASASPASIMVMV